MKNRLKLIYRTPLNQITLDLNLFDRELTVNERKDLFLQIYAKLSFFFGLYR